MRIVKFNGCGQPELLGINDGDILILFTHDSAEVVKLKLLPPDNYGPELTRAKNWKELESAALWLIKSNHPDYLKQTERHWVFECPEELALKAEFG